MRAPKRPSAVVLTGPRGTYWQLRAETKQLLEETKRAPSYEQWT